MEIPSLRHPQTNQIYSIFDIKKTINVYFYKPNGVFGRRFFGRFTHFQKSSRLIRFQSVDAIGSTVIFFFLVFAYSFHLN